MNKTYFYIFLFSIILFVGQLFAGSITEVAFFFSIAVFLGLCSVFVTGSWRSNFGILNLAILIKFLLFALIIKIICLQPSDYPLFAPLETSIVTLLGFAGVLIGTIIQKKLPVPKRRLIYPINDKNFYLILYLFFLIVGYGAWLYIYITRQDAELDMTVGGVFGLLTAFGEFRDLSITAVLYYVHLSGSKKFLTHPLVIFTITVTTLAGIYSVSKQAIIQPLVYFCFSILAIKGPNYKPFWIALIVGGLLFTNVVYPFSQFARYGGGRTGTTMQRVTAIAEILPKMILDPDYSEVVNTALDKKLHTYEPYLPVAGYSLGRMAMVAEADRLVAASANTENTGWETITWGFKMVLPRFIYPDKPILASNNYLARIAGQVGGNDYLTQVSYGFMANFYNAFGYAGALIGSTLLIGGLYYWLTLFFGDYPNINIWTIAIFGQYNHLLSEQSIAGIIASIPFPLVMLVLFITTKNIAKKLS